MVFGDVNKERIQLNEESMWSGSPDDNDNPDAFPAQAKIPSYRAIASRGQQTDKFISMVQKILLMVLCEFGSNCLIFYSCSQFSSCFRFTLIIQYL